MAILAAAVDGNSLGLCLCALGLRQGDGEHAVLEIGADLVVLDLVAERDAALEAAVEALRELTLLVLGLGLFSPFGVSTPSSSRTSRDGATIWLQPLTISTRRLAGGVNFHSMQEIGTLMI
jgi:hypothetical protein